MKPAGFLATAACPAALRIRLALRLLAALAFALATGALRAAEPQAFYVNYSAQVPTAPLLAHPLSS